MRTYHAGQVSKRGPGQDAVEPHSASASSVERVALATSRVRSRGCRYAVATLLALALSGCHEHLSSGAPVVEMSYHDGGIVCFVAAHDYAPVGISCVRAEVRP